MYQEYWCNRNRDGNVFRWHLWRAIHGNVWKSSVKELGRCWFVRQSTDTFSTSDRNFQRCPSPSQTTVNDPFLPRFHQFRLKKKKAPSRRATTSTLNRYIFDWYLTRRLKILRETSLLEDHRVLSTTMFMLYV